MAEGGADVVRELLVRLGVIADTAEAKRFDISLKNIALSMGGLTGIAATVKGAIAGVVTATALAGDRVAKTSQKIGVEVEALQELEYAAGLSGVATTDLAVALKFLNVNIDKAASGGKEQAKAFAAMGVSVKNADGSLRTADDVLTDLAGKFEKMPDGPKKTAEAVDLFGRSGAAMIPMLNSGTEGIRQMREEAIALGVVMDKATTKASEAFNDELDRLHKSVTGVGNAVAERLLDPLTRVTEKVRRWVAENRELLAQRIERTFTVLGDAIDGVGTAFEVVWDWVTKVTDVLGGMENTLKIVAAVFVSIIGVQAVAAVASLTTAMAGMSAASLGPALIVAAVAGVLLILEDLYTYMQGGESQFGEFWGPFVTGANEVYDAFERLGDISLTDIIEGQWGNFKAFIVEGLDSLAETIQAWGGNVAQAIRERVLSFIKPVTDVIESIGAAFGAKLGGAATAAAELVGGGASSANAAQMGEESASSANAAQMVAGVTNSTTRNIGGDTTITSAPTINVTVTGGAGNGAGAAGQAADIARQVAGAVEKTNAVAMRQAALNYAP